MMSVRLFSTLSGLSGMIGVVLVGVSFAAAVGINVTIKINYL